MRSFRKTIFVSILIVFLFAGCEPRSFNEQRAYGYIATQLSFGHRIPGTVSSRETLHYLNNELMKLGWETEIQEFEHKDVQLTNLIAKNSPAPPAIILGTHYDTRTFSDRDPDEDKRATPVPGANDGASGTAVLLELAHNLLNNDQSIWIVLFDAEDQGNINGWDWSVGSQYFADRLSHQPEKAIIIDMIGDTDLNIYYEGNSSDELAKNIWDIAEKLGYGDSFIKETKYSVIDDHLPLLNNGIPTTLIIDLDYEKWHTTQDNLDHVSADSLKKVGSVLLTFLID